MAMILGWKFALLLVNGPYLQNEFKAMGCKLTANESWLSGDDAITAMVLCCVELVGSVWERSEAINLDSCTFWRS